jgi:hypothetical protein
VGSAVAAQTVGRAYVTSRLPVWEEQYPWLALAIDLFEMREALEAEMGSLAEPLERHAGENDKSLLPPDVVVYPEPMEETYSISPDRVSGFQRVAGSPEPVISYFRQEMPAHGWTLDSERETPRATLLNWTSQTGRCQTEIVTLERTSEIWIRCSRQPQ